MNEKRIHSILQISYGVLLMVGAVSFLLRQQWGFNLYAAGAVLAVVQTLTYALQNRTDDIREARQQRLMFILSLMLGVSAYYMYLGENMWVGFMAAYAVGTLFLSFRGKKDD